MHALKNVNDRFVAKVIAAFGVSYLSGIEKHQSVNLSGIDVQSASFARLPEHLHHTGKVMMSQASAEAGVGLIEHLRRLKALGLADDNLFDVGGDRRWRAVPVDIVVTSGLKRFQQGALAAVSDSNDRQSRVLRVGVNNVGNFKSAHFAHVGGAQYRYGRVIFQSRQGKGCLIRGNYFEPFFSQRISQALRKVNV